LDAERVANKNDDLEAEQVANETEEAVSQGEIAPVAEEDEDHSGWFGLVFNIYCFIKAAILIFLSLQGIMWWRKDCKKNWNIIVLLIVGIIVIGWEAIYRLGPKNIAPIFILQVMAQHSVIGAVQTLHSTKLVGVRDRFGVGWCSPEKRVYFFHLMYAPFHLAYIALYAIAFNPNLGAFCADGRLVPHCFLMANIVFFCGYFFNVYLQYFTGKALPPGSAAVRSGSFHKHYDSADDVKNTRWGGPCDKGMDKKPELTTLPDGDQILTNELLFKEQAKRLFTKYNVLVGMFVAQMVIAFSLQHAKGRFVECKVEGHVGAGWGVNSMLGILIFMSHVMPAMFCCALPRYVFIKEVSGGFFDTLTADLGGKAVSDDDFQ